MHRSFVAMKLRDSVGNKARAARSLGWSRAKLQRYMASHDVTGDVLLKRGQVIDYHGRPVVVILKNLRSTICADMVSQDQVVISDTDLRWKLSGFLCDDMVTVFAKLMWAKTPEGVGDDSESSGLVPEEST